MCTRRPGTEVLQEKVALEANVRMLSVTCSRQMICHGCAVAVQEAETQAQTAHDKKVARVIRAKMQALINADVGAEPKDGEGQTHDLNKQRCRPDSWYGKTLPGYSHYL